MGNDLEPPAAPIWLARLAVATARASTTEQLVDELLVLLQEMTGLESTYLTRIDWDADTQEILRSLNAGSMSIEPGLVVPWADTLCKRAMDDGVQWESDVPDRWGDSEAARELGIHTYVSVPVNVGVGERPWGTLCGVASDARPADELIRSTLALFAQLIGAALRDEQRVADAEARLASHTAFIATAEHAMKTPAATALMWAEQLLAHRDRMTADQVDDAITRIRNNAQRLLTLLQDLLAGARAELTSRDLALAPVDLDLLADHAAEALSAPDHTIEVHHGGAWAFADERAVALVLDHLLDNSRAYTPSGCTTTISTWRDGDRAVLEVGDDGPGLPAGLDVFEPFVRGTTDGHGTGLGLSIVAGLVAAQGGTISKNNHGGGAVFTISLPAADAPEPV